MTREQVARDAAGLGADDADVLLRLLIAGGYARRADGDAVEPTPEGERLLADA